MGDKDREETSTSISGQQMCPKCIFQPSPWGPRPLHLAAL